MGRRLLRTGLGLLLCLCLSGCSFSMLDAQNLMAPPKANADQPAHLHIRWLDFVPDLPRSSNGKLQRYKLR